MAHRKSAFSKKDAVEIFRGLVVLAFLAYGSVMAWWNSLSPDYRMIFVGLITVFFGSTLTLIVLLIRHYRKQQTLARKRAMTIWNQPVKQGQTFETHSARRFLEDELEEFASQVYKKMGYRAKHTGQTGDHGVDVLLMNPNKEIEIVQCKQWRKPVGEREVRDLMGAMTHYNAVRGWLWAPGGFSSPARIWAKNKPIVLADDEEIGRLVQSAYEN